jgi:hypothetical protein
MPISEMLTAELNDLISKSSVLDVLLVLAEVLEKRHYTAEAALVSQAAEL